MDRFFAALPWISVCVPQLHLRVSCSFVVTVSRLYHESSGSIVIIGWCSVCAAPDYRGIELGWLTRLALDSPPGNHEARCVVVRLHIEFSVDKAVCFEFPLPFLSKSCWRLSRLLVEGRVSFIHLCVFVYSALHFSRARSYRVISVIPLVVCLLYIRCRESRFVPCIGPLL